MFAITTVLDVVIQNALDEGKESLPDDREGVTRLNLVVGNTVDCSSRLGLLTAQHLVGCANDLCKARAGGPKAIDGLGSCQLDDAATY